MTSTVFQDFVTPVPASWLNDVNTSTYVTVPTGLSARPTSTTLAAAEGATLIGNTPAGNIAATTVQAALNELDAEKARLAGLSTQTFSVATATAAAHAVPKSQFDAGVAGSVIQTVSAAYSTQTLTTSATLVDTGLTATITPKYATSKILVIVNQTASIPDASTATYITVALLREATSIWTDQRIGGFAPAAGTNVHTAPSASVLDSPATTSATTYKTKFASGTAGQAVQAQHANLRTSTITLMEIAQ